ncbi:hypothetical protein ACFUJY_29890 [Streptomyces sp. NPDC057249]|uniref:hypothetical protein n=1 Tax=Streptomyces sp. NPDC057249 TaxID=3346067 RepID=UPI00362D8723
MTTTVHVPAVGGQVLVNPVVLTTGAVMPDAAFKQREGEAGLPECSAAFAPAQVEVHVVGHGAFRLPAGACPDSAYPEQYLAVRGPRSGSSPVVCASWRRSSARRSSPGTHAA